MDHDDSLPLLHSLFDRDPVLKKVHRILTIFCDSTPTSSSFYWYEDLRRWIGGLSPASVAINSRALLCCTPLLHSSVALLCCTPLLHSLLTDLVFSRKVDRILIIFSLPKCFSSAPFSFYCDGRVDDSFPQSHSLRSEIDFWYLYLYRYLSIDLPAFRLFRCGKTSAAHNTMSTPKKLSDPSEKIVEHAYTHGFARRGLA